MSRQIILTQYRLRLGNPQRLAGCFRFLTGALLLSFTYLLVSDLATHAESIGLGEGDQLQATLDRSPGRAAWAVLLLFHLVFALYLGLRGLASALSGLFRMVSRLYLPAVVPADINKAEETLREVVVSRSIATYQKPRGTWRWLRELSPRLDYIPPTLQEVFTRFGRRRLWFWGILFAAAFYFGEGWWAAMRADPGFEALVSPSPWVLLAVCFIVPVVRIGAALLLLPGDPPEVDFQRRVEMLEGASHPGRVQSDVELRADTYRYLDIPNRFWKREPGLAADTDRTGQIFGGFVYETQPEPLQIGNKAFALLYTILAWVSWGLAVAILTRLLPAPQAVLSLPAPVNVPTMVAHGLGALILLRVGGQFDRFAQMLFMRMRFISDAVVFDLSGTYARSSVKAGGAYSDSLSSGSEGIKSDARLEFHGARIITECVNLGPRQILATAPSEDFNERIGGLFEAARSTTQRGVQLTNIDTRSNEVAQRLAQSNVAIEERKAQARSTPPPIAELPDTNPRQLPAHDPEADPESEEASPPPAATKECPECAETVLAKARKCRFCGHRFEETLPPFDAA